MLYPGRMYCPLSLVSSTVEFRKAVLDGDLEGIQRAIAHEKSCCPFVCPPPTHTSPYTTPVLLALCLKHSPQVIDVLLSYEPQQPLRRVLRREFAVFCGEAPLADIQRLVEYFGRPLLEPEVVSTSSPVAAWPTALHYACFRGDATVMQYLTTHGGADWTVSATHKAVTPLHVLNLTTFNLHQQLPKQQRPQQQNGHDAKNEEEHDDVDECTILPYLTSLWQEQPELWFATDRQGRTALAHLLDQAPTTELRSFIVSAWLQRQG
jgi:hypothetical protein